ncbi:MAG: UDP-N-acetylmuramate dehydrogenase [Alphaproteobacteria bacterium]|nr:MAG: UDP-N-acetylmuramate dehydrogenase [Alphaproteobacteria bacterium]
MDSSLIVNDFALTHLNTMGLKARARFGAEVKSVVHLQALVAFAEEEGVPLRIIGGGSNLLPHEDVNAVVGVMAMRGFAVTGETEDATLVTAQAGEQWSDFVRWTVGHGLGGLENLVEIPGTVGAAPIQNIGAYGLEIADRLHSLTAYDLEEGKLRVFMRDECGFGYRQSMFKKLDGRYVVLVVTLALPKVWQPILSYAGLDSLPADVDAVTVMERVAALRASKLPDWRVLGNAGSFFHNPVVTAEAADGIAGVPRYPQADGTVKLSAAWLIDACGLKGYRDGPVGVYAGHALILVNHGGAAYRDIARLAQTIREAVRAKFAVELVQEPLELF